MVLPSLHPGFSPRAILARWSGNRLRTKLLFSTLTVVCLLMAAVLAVVQARIRSHVRGELGTALHTEASVYAEVEAARRRQLQQSAELIAALPSVKALLSTDDAVTVQDASETILQTSGADLLILENPKRQVL